MLRSLQQDDLATQISVYNHTVDTVGRGAAFDFYDKVVSLFVTSLAERNQVGPAVQAMERARRTLRVEPGGPLDREITDVIARLKSGKFGEKSSSP